MNRKWTAFLLLLFITVLPVSPLYASSIGTFREDDKPEGQRESGLSNSVGVDGEWRVRINGNTVVAVGVGEVPFQFVFSDTRTGKRYNSTVVASAFAMSEDSHLLGEDFAAAIEYLTGYAHEVFGDRARFISYDNIPQETGGNCYIIYCELWDESYQQYYPVTIAYRFGKSYYLFAMGVDQGDLPEVFHITKDAAKSFQDYSTYPLSGYDQIVSTAGYSREMPPFRYDLINPFLMMAEYIDY